MPRVLLVLVLVAIVFPIRTARADLAVHVVGIVQAALDADDPAGPSFASIEADTLAPALAGLTADQIASLFAERLLTRSDTEDGSCVTTELAILIGPMGLGVIEETFDLLVMQCGDNVWPLSANASRFLL